MGRAVRQLLVLALGGAFALVAQAGDEDALSLPGESPSVGKTGAKELQLVVEAAVGTLDLRNARSSGDARRASVDLRLTKRLSDPWTVTFSHRLDDVHPVLPGQRSTRNSLRELSLAWSDPAGDTTVEAGRVNLRNGPAFGFNPTDYFRDGALRTVTTADPIALRTNRLGTFMVRASRLWTGGGLSLALAPKLDDGPDHASWSVDAGATNRRNRALLAYSATATERLSGQVFLFGEQGKGPQWGANAAWLGSGAVVAFAEGSVGSGASLLDQSTQASSTSEAKVRRHSRLAAGLTYSFASRLSLTLEAEYNGAGLDRGQWGTLLASGPEAYARYLAITQPSMELGSRRAWLAYATQRDFGVKNLDVTVLMRVNAVDHSRLVWLEGRFHWDRFDMALQWQGSSGKAGSEFGVMPYRRLVQWVGAWYF